MAKEIKEKHPMREALTVSGIAFVANVIIGLLMVVSIGTVATVSVIISVIIVLLVYSLGRMKNEKIANWIACTMAIMFFGWIGVGGIDCEPPDDADLMLPQSAEPYTSEGNGWVMLSNVLSQVESLGDEYDTNRNSRSYMFGSARDRLLWYVDPDEQAYLLDAIMDDTPDFLSCFTNVVNSSSYVEDCLKSNAWLITGIDAILDASIYVPPPVSDGYPFVGKWFQINRSFLLARVKQEIEKGNFDVAIEYYGRNLRLATLLQTRAAQFSEYSLGTYLIDENASFLERVIDDIMIPAKKLQAFADLLKDLPGFSQEAATYALKREYACLKASFMINPVDAICPYRSDFFKAWYSPFCRYRYHPNRTFRTAAKSIRGAIKGDVTLQSCAEGARRGNKWIDDLAPNSYSGIVLYDDDYYKRQIKRARETSQKVESVRRKIADRIAASKSGGDFVASGRYFPLVFTNGFYYTHDLKKIIGAGRGNEPAVVGGDAEIIDEASFNNVKTIVIPVECKECLEKWGDIFTDPWNLQKVIGADRHPEIGISGGVLYDRKTKRALNFVGNKKTIVVPKDVVVDNTDLLIGHLPYNGVERLHFCGPLSEFRTGRGSAKDTLARRIKKWWKYKRWYDFKCIFMQRPKKGALHRTSSKLVVTVSREGADARTREIVDSGMWEGRQIRWGDPPSENEDDATYKGESMLQECK